MIVELNQATEVLIEREIRAGTAPDAKTLIEQALHSYIGEQEEEHDSEEAIRDSLAAAEEIRQLRKGVTLGPGLTIRDLIEEGRR